MVAWGVFLVLFGGTAVVSCPPHLICRLLSCSYVEIRTPWNQPEFWLCSVPSLRPARSSLQMQLHAVQSNFLDCLKGTLYTQALISLQMLAVFY